MNGMTRMKAVWVATLFVAMTAGLPSPARGTVEQEQDAATRYELARRALNDAQFARAVELLRLYRQQDPGGRYVPESLYWEGFALSRMESTADLRAALDVLRSQLELYPQAPTTADARSLLARVHGELARRGDSESARWVYENSAEAAQDRGREGLEREQERDIRTDETKLAALQALMNMNSERAVPILRRVVQDHDNTPELRVQALFILSQQEGDDVSDLMLEVARSDPDPQVREQAVFCLSQAGTERALPVLESILSNPGDARLHEQALFAIAQLDDPRAYEVLRDYARSSSAPPELRKNAIFWLGQSGAGGSAALLRELWDSTTDRGVREAILFSMSQMDEGENASWLMDVALDESENIEIRKQALFMAGQRDDVDAAGLAGIYDRALDRELRQQALFVLSQSDDPAAFEKLIEVARSSDEDPELRENAIFWLGQSDDPRAEEILLEILE